MNNELLSKFTKLTKFTKYQFEIETEIWIAFKTLAIANGMKMKDAIKQAIIEFIQNHKLPNQEIQVKIIENKEAKENILQIIYEEEVRDVLKELMNAKQRKANVSYINEQKSRLFDLLKKTPISKDLAEEIKIVLQNLRT